MLACLLQVSERPFQRFILSTLPTPEEIFVNNYLHCAVLVKRDEKSGKLNFSILFGGKKVDDVTVSVRQEQEKKCHIVDI